MTDVLVSWNVLFDMMITFQESFGIHSKCFDRFTHSSLVIMWYDRSNVSLPMKTKWVGQNIRIEYQKFLERQLPCQILREICMFQKRQNKFRMVSGTSEMDQNYLCEIEQRSCLHIIGTTDVTKTLAECKIVILVVRRLIMITYYRNADHVRHVIVTKCHWVGARIYFVKVFGPGNRR